VVEGWEVNGRGGGVGLDAKGGEEGEEGGRVEGVVGSLIQVREKRKSQIRRP